MLPDSIPQIDAMRMGVDYRFEIKCRNFSLLCRPLSIGENNQVYSKVLSEMSMVPEGQKHRLHEHTLLAMETLVLASTSDVGVQDPKLSNLIIQKMTNEEIMFLFKQYVAGCDRANPCLEKMDDAELRKIVEEVKKSPAEALESQLIELSFLELVNICRFMIQGG